jgi:hypothetical protein
MECSDARHLIHLDVGNDLRAEEEGLLAGHMEHCGECRVYHTETSQAMNALYVLRDDPATRPESGSAARSVWANVSQKIQQRRTAPALARRFNVQVAALSVCSLSLAVVTIVQSLSAMRGSDEPSGYMLSQPVSNLSAPSLYQPHGQAMPNELYRQQQPQPIPVKSPPQSF